MIGQGSNDRLAAPSPVPAGNILRMQPSILGRASAVAEAKGQDILMLLDTLVERLGPISAFASEFALAFDVGRDLRAQLTAAPVGGSDLLTA